VRRTGAVFRATLASELEGIEVVGDVRGRGYFIGIEFVADRTTRAPFDGTLGFAARVGRAAAADGLLCYPIGGNVDGLNGDAVILAPPFNASDAELEEIRVRFAAAVRTAVASL
jgi:adenosylmethionine-8-amino-7-oxononanoate aminotransferase